MRDKQSPSFPDHILEKLNDEAKKTNQEKNPSERREQEDKSYFF